MSKQTDPIESAVDAMDESGAFENGVFHVDRGTIRMCFLAGLDAYFTALGTDTSTASAKE